MAEGTNFRDAAGEVAVTPQIPLVLSTVSAKSFDPTAAIATAGRTVQASLTGTNTSNATVERLVLQDPADLNAVPNPFTLLGFAGFGAVETPAGATATYELQVPGRGWVLAPSGSLPDGVDASEVRGTRVVFSGEIAPGAQASAVLELQMTEAATELADGASVLNTVSSTVELGEETAAHTSSAPFVVQQNAVAVSGTRSFTPDVILAGESTTVQLQGRNDSAITGESLTLTEPAVEDLGSTAPERPTRSSPGGTVSRPRGRSR